MSVLIVMMMYAVWSSVFSLGKMALEVSPPLFLTSSRMLLAGILLLGFLAIFKRSQLKFSPKLLIPLALYGFLGMYLANAFEFWSLQHLSAAKTCFLYSLSPFLAAFFSYLHFGEKMNRRKWIGMGIGLAGILPVLAIQTGSESLIGGLFFLSWPELSMMAAVLCSSYGWILLRLLVKDSAVSPSLSNGVGMLIGGAFALVHSIYVDSWNPLPVASGSMPAFAQGIILMTLVSNIVCSNLYGFVLKRFTATFVSFMGLLSPVFASINSWLFLGEAPSLVIFLSTGVVSLGLYLVYSAELKQGYIRKAEASEPAAAAN
jgi:drug/metabolite transporter (DMT)-like permease